MTGKVCRDEVIFFEKGNLKVGMLGKHKVVMVRQQTRKQCRREVPQEMNTTQN